MAVEVSEGLFAVGVALAIVGVLGALILLGLCFHDTVLSPINELRRDSRAHLGRLDLHDAYFRKVLERLETLEKK